MEPLPLKEDQVKEAVSFKAMFDPLASSSQQASLKSFAHHEPSFCLKSTIKNIPIDRWAKSFDCHLRVTGSSPSVESSLPGCHMGKESIRIEALWGVHFPEAAYYII